MKTLLSALILASCLATPAMASQVSCEKSIEMAVRKAVKESQMPTKIASISYQDIETDLLLNLALKQATVVHAGSATASTWLVVVRPGPMGTCRPLVVYDSAIGAP